MTNKYGRSAAATLVIVPKKNPGKSGGMSYMCGGFITNIKVGDPKDLIWRIPKEYRLLWGIETGYRKLEEARARTNSPRYSARLLLLFFTIVLLNFWLLYQDMYADMVPRRIWCFSTLWTAFRCTSTRPTGPRDACLVRGKSRREWQLPHGINRRAAASTQAQAAVAA